MSSPCLSGGGRSYGFELERVKSSPSAASTATASASAITSSLTSSPSSTLSESSNSPLAISTRKPRTPRKRPNQTYNEAAALLSTVYPNIFSTITNHHKFTTPGALLLDQPSDLLLSPFPVFDTPGFLLRHQYHHQNHYRPIDKPDEPRLTNLTIPSYQSCGEVDSPMGTTDSTNSMEVCEEEDDLDTGSILDEEIGEGIDSIMGNLSVGSEMAASGGGGGGELNSWRSMGYNFGGKFQPGIRAFRNLEERSWWCFPIVDMLQISPRLSSSSSNSNGEQEKEKNSTRNSNSNTNPKLKPEPDASEKRKKKKKKKVEKAVVAELAEEVEEVGKNWSAAAQPDKQSLLLKLNYKEVLDAWSDRGSPYSDQGLGSDGKDASARLALIDLFSDGGGMREASVLRYKEKRRTRLFSKKIRYQVRKVNADRRPRMKGRFVRRLSSSSSGQRREK